jgi:hypothetical protein
VKRLAAGLPLDEVQAAAARVPAADDQTEQDGRVRHKERPTIVPALNKPITQE